MSERLQACVYRYVSDSFVFSRELEERIQERYLWRAEIEIVPDDDTFVEELDSIVWENPEFKDEVERFKGWKKEIENLKYNSCVFETK